MFSQRVSHVTLELFRWVALWLMASMAVAFFANTAGGVPPTNPVAKLTPLPPDVMERATPMPMPNVDAPQEFRYPLDLNYEMSPPAGELWRVVALHSQGRHAEAIVAWQSLDVREHCLEWKHVGVGAAYAASEMTGEAEYEFGQALRYNPDNAVVVYLWARLRDQQLNPTPLRHDTSPETPFRVASQRYDGRRDQMFLPRFDRTEALRVEAMYQRAVELADTCDLNHVLQVKGRHAVEFASLPQPTHSTAEVPPTVRDLLRALDADNFVEQSFEAVARLQLARGAVAEAELTLDDAASRGYDVAELLSQRC